MIFGEKIRSVVIGVQYIKRFGLANIMGSLVDDILYDEGTDFGPLFFPRIESGFEHRALVNEETGDKLIIEPSQIVFVHKIGNKWTDDYIQVFHEKYIKNIIERIFKKHKVFRVNRLGHILEYEVGETDSTHLSFGVSENIVKNASEFNFKYSIGIPTECGLAAKKIDDYTNQIVSVKKSKGNNSYIVSYDYQYYFIPSLHTLETKDCKSFFSEALANSNKFMLRITGTDGKKNEKSSRY